MAQSHGVSADSHTLLHAVAEIQVLYSAMLTIGFSQTFTSGASGAVTVDVATNQHGTITRGK